MIASEPIYAAAPETDTALRRSNEISSAKTAILTVLDQLYGRRAVTEPEFDAMLVKFDEMFAPLDARNDKPTSPPSPRPGRASAKFTEGQRVYSRPDDEYGVVESMGNDATVWVSLPYNGTFDHQRISCLRAASDLELATETNEIDRQIDALSVDDPQFATKLDALAKQKAEAPAPSARKLTETQRKWLTRIAERDGERDYWAMNTPDKRMATRMEKKEYIYFEITPGNAWRARLTDAGPATLSAAGKAATK